MIKLGERQNLKYIKKTDFGIYVGNSDEEKVLLPKKQVPENLKYGEMIDVFVYRDSSDRLIATTNQPYINLGSLAVLKVKAVGKLGAFMDWGLEKDLFLPYGQQTTQVKPEKEYLVALYIDKSNRLAATMNIYKYLKPADKFSKNDMVNGIVYKINSEIGAFVAVENEFYGLIPNQELHGKINVGDVVTARVTEVRADGKINLSPNKNIHLQIEDDAKKVLEVINEYDGVLPYGEKVSPEIISRDFGLSKNAFKRAVGHLLKNGMIDITEKSIKIKSEN